MTAEELRKCEPTADPVLAEIYRRALEAMERKRVQRSFRWRRPEHYKREATP